MTVTLLKILLIIILAFIFVQDLRYRVIHVLLPISLGIVGYILLKQSGNTIYDLLPSFLFVSITVLGLWMYLSIKNRSLVNPLKSAIGIGDILFFVMIIPLFSFVNYIYFYIIGLLLSALIHILFSKRSKDNTIPLAGYLSTYLIILYTFEIITQSNILYYI